MIDRDFFTSADERANATLTDPAEEIKREAQELAERVRRRVETERAQMRPIKESTLEEDA